MTTPKSRHRQPPGLFRLRSARRLPPGSSVQLWVRSHPHPGLRRLRRWLSLLLTALLLWGAIVLLVFSLRWSVQLMVNPEALPWLQARLGQPASDLVETVTLADVTAEVSAQGQKLGEPLPLNVTQQDTELEFLLYPVLKSAGQTAEIVELRLYRPLPGGPRAKVPKAKDPQPKETPQALMQAVATLPVERLADEVILAPMLRTSQKILPAQQAFPMTAIQPLPSASAPGVWLTLQGQWQRSGVTLRYGRFVYFDPRKRTLETLTAWSTPTRQLPRWSNLDGAAPADLLIDETVGLEPALRGYRVQPRQGLGAGIQLLPVSINSVPADVSDSGGAYYRALSLARNGLWSEAAKQLQPLKAKLNKSWTPAAEAQLQLVQIHADRTRQQADRKWSVPSQQILSSLIDGRWEAALKQLEAAPQAQEPLMRTLAQDEGRFWNRVTAALRSGKKEPAALVWGGLILKAQQDQQTALAWLAEQKVPAAIRSRFWAVANPPAVADLPPRSTATAATTPVSTAAEAPQANLAPLQALLGQATPLPSANLGQWQPIQGNQLPALGAQQRWYEIQVVGWQQWDTWGDHQQGGWQTDDPTVLRAALAAVVAEPIYLLPQGASPSAAEPLQVQGVRLEGGQLQLLAAGRGNAAGLVFSADSLYWPDASAGVSAQGQGAIATALETLLAPTVSREALQPVLASATLHTLDVTADGRQDWLLTLQAQDLERLADLGVNVDRSGPKTLIFNPEGLLLYSDLFLPQRLAAVTNPVRSRFVALLTEQATQYRLQHWSSEQRQFE